MSEESYLENYSFKERVEENISEMPKTSTPIT